MKLFYLPDTKAIVAKYNNKFVSLPNGEEIKVSKKLIPCLAFLKECKSSQWNPVPDDSDSFYKFFNKYSKYEDVKPREIIKIHKVELAVTWCINEVGESFFKLHGNLPVYVLNGIANVLLKEYYEKVS